ncbi:NUDIX hydrolase [Aeromicrobium wangtongii]|uniref:NUDIX domain-containing protein n=1 Tax=Aeromicrobium wangtongii TaxID=2969247 RepID=A0ABY5M7T2_9ACTN|nr:NUDIX domain-containing protein [Aeromicrobium wangtongii]MCD9198772.1 NUDIX domain-containing protein [Aeromicrobium wangtongii]UUP13186.1 NUDIX domain-containing protein [Aeromicrobium wangtongii]
MSEARRTQRLGAYAVVLDDERILLTRISSVGYPAGTWTLPGGGVDHGESPHDSVVRELYEEAGLRAISSRLVDVHDVHVVAPGRDDQYEDYHGVHLLYAVEVDTSVQPRVTDVGGTTDLVAWVPVDEIGSVVAPVLPMVEHVLAHLDQFGAGV